MNDVVNASLSAAASFLPKALRAAAVLKQVQEQRAFHGCVNYKTLGFDEPAAIASVDALLARCGDPQDYAYIAPEQTGRLNRGVDRRSDYYSLGAVYYQLLTGRPPFINHDTMGMVHSHIAQQAVPPHELVPELPKAVSAIVLKLLSKNAEERYQSIDGLLFDLEQCEKALGESGMVPEFALGSRDRVGMLRISSRLYGREAELQRLRDAFARTARNGNELFLIGGYSGIGKSSLAHEIHQSVVARGGFYLSGKFDQHRGRIPYATLADAFRDLIQMLLSGSEQDLAHWREILMQAVGKNGRLLTDVIPELAYLIGEQPPLVELASAEAQNRFLSLFCQFVAAFAGADHPLVIFLDDLQWAEPASLKLLERIATHPDINHLLLIGSYRDNEVDATHPLTQSIQAIGKQGGSIETLALTPVKQSDVQQMLADMLDCEVEPVRPLADLLFQKTAGNPFFTVQFLSTLHEEGLLVFDAASAAWHWDIARIRAVGFTDNVADLMAAKLDRLPEQTLGVLKYLACLGAGAPIGLVARVAETSIEQAESRLAEPQQAGLLMRVGELVKFSHDRIHEAAYTMIAPSAREVMHLHIARTMMSSFNAERIEQEVFSLLDQFNRGAALIRQSEERAELCRLNALAGRKAKAAVAYLSARNYLQLAIGYLPEGAWEEKYADTFALYLDCAECESAIGEFARADALLDQIFIRARSPYDSARAALVRIRTYFAASQGQKSIHTGLEALALFGVVFPESGEELAAYVEEGRQELEQRLRHRNIADLIDLPVVETPEVRIVIGLLAEVLTAAYSARPALALPILIKALNMSLEHGNVEESCVIYSNYGLLLAGSFGDLESGCAFSEMSLRLNERFADQKRRGRLLYIHGFAFQGIREPLATCVPVLEKAFNTCLEVGNIHFAGASIDAMIWMAVESGMPMEQVRKLAAPYRDFARQNNIFPLNCVMHTLDLLFARLRNEKLGSEPPLLEEDLLRALNEGGWNYSLVHFHINQLIRYYLFGEYENALDAAQFAKKMPASLQALASMPTNYFYHALTLAALFTQADEEAKPALRQEMQTQLDKLSHWARSRPENYGARYALATAELARIDARHDEAMLLYEQAVAAARAAGLVQQEALANELAARYYWQRGLHTCASGHVIHARNAYARWGASLKVAELDRLYPGIAEEAAQAVSGSQQAAGGMRELDFIAVTEASQAVSGEIVLAKLIETLMKTVIENAGADRGLLILEKQDGFEVAAEADARAGQVLVSLRASAVREDELPLSLFHYVTRTQERLLIDDATAPNPYARDPYFLKGAPKSVLCLPLMKQGRLIGVLYLENKLAASVFTPGRISMLKLLASQAAISLESATLYTVLQHENSERKRAQEALKEKTIELQAQASFMNAVIENIPIAVFAKDARDEFRYTVWNKAAEEIFRMPKELILGKTGDEIWPPEIADVVLEQDTAAALGKQRLDIPEQVVHIDKQGSILLHTIKVPLVNPTDTETDYLVGISEDITERKRSESMIWQQANFDALTGLPNRTRFRDQLLRDIGKCNANGSKLAVLFIDLDRFKEVNDTLGHDIGDQLLIEAARRIGACVRDSDTVARLGGDEFTVILPGLDNAGRIEAIAQNMIDALVKPFELGQEQAFISASIGVTIYPDDATEIEELLKHADQALYVAKDSGRNRFGYYTPALQIAAVNRMRMTNDMRSALDKGEFQAYFQPIVNAATGGITKAEALIRWQHPQRGLVSPAEFIPLAESSGLIMDIGEWMFHEAARYVKEWRAHYHPDFQVSINQSPLEFQRQEDRYDRWVEHLRSVDLPGQAVVVEITEGLLLDADPVVVKKLLTLRDAGIQVALDDFGTGYSSLAYLKKFDIDYLKIDQAFIRNLTQGSNDLALIEAMIMMAHKLGLKVIAEGVETVEQHELLRIAGCDYNQGYLFSRPVPGPQFEELLKIMKK
jgi:diguanylate cyclase (GGDEF)-like protein/PAS domain S-box-containing protein